MDANQKLMSTIAKYSAQLTQDSRDGNSLATLVLEHYQNYQAKRTPTSRKSLVECLTKWLETQ